MIAIEKDIDKQFLHKYYKDMVDEIGDIFHLFIDEIPQDLKKVKQTFASANYKEASEILHKIAPSFFSVGLPELTAKIQPIEKNITAKNFNEAYVGIVLLEKDISSYMPALQRECIRLKAISINR